MSTECPRDWTTCHRGYCAREMRCAEDAASAPFDRNMTNTTDLPALPEPDLRFANPIGLTPPMKELQREKLQAMGSAPEHPAERTEFVIDTLLSALNGMMTFFGMDEDEVSKPTFDDARHADEYARIATRPLEPHEREALAHLRSTLHGWHARAVALGADGVDNVLHAAEVAKRRGELRTVDGFVSEWRFPAPDVKAEQPSAAVEANALIDIVLDQCSGYLIGPGYEAAEAARRLRAALAAPPEPLRVGALSDAAEAYLEAQGALDNRELNGINAESHGVLQRRVHAARDHLETVLATSAAEVPAEWSKAVQEAYGWLWHVNNEPMAPIQMWSPESAAHEARKCLRDLLTTEQRGEAINAVQGLLANKAATTPGGKKP
jgi:hypothetical protein